MAYFAPYIDSTGIHIPTYTDIRDDLVAQAKKIFGEDIYLGNDSADYQYICAVALRTSDALETLAAVYNSRSPVTAIGTGLDAVVKINGITRKSASHSTCTVTLTGTPGTVIKAGIVEDEAGNKWDLPPNIGFGASTEIRTTATCETVGAVVARIGDLHKIGTPQMGWTAVTNEQEASIGEPVETDAELRARQALSVEIPSRSLLAGTVAGILSVQNVTRQKVYENDTSQVSAEGFPPHSITCVVEGGADEAIAEQIYLRKGIGCYTNGTTEIEVPGKYGLISYIRFYRPTYVDIDVSVTIKKYAGYVNTTDALILENIVRYLNGLDIGETLSAGLLWHAALAANADLYNPTFTVTSVQVGRHGGTIGTVDITTAFYEVVRGNEEYVTLKVV